jgi:hypothetical protein
MLGMQNAWMGLGEALLDGRPAGILLASDALRMSRAVLGGRRAQIRLAELLERVRAGRFCVGERGKPRRECEGEQ